MALVHRLAWKSSSKNASLQAAARSLTIRTNTNLSPILKRPFLDLQDDSKTAIIDQAPNKAVSYGTIKQQSVAVAHELLTTVGTNERVGFLVTPDSTWVSTILGCWLSNNTAVPLCNKHSLSELDYVLTDSHAAAIVTDHAYTNHAENACDQASVPSLIHTEPLFDKAAEVDVQRALNGLPRVTADDDALVIYTSGTTSKPKGVLTTHATVNHQIASLHRAWQWTPEDVIMNVLPLHHIHGVVNVVLSAITQGATVEMCQGFDAKYTFDRLAGLQSPSCDSRPLSIFMAVPTVYSKLLKQYDERSEQDQAEFSAGTQALRLIVSGSAALPQTVFERCKAVTGHALLERYGMTEIGMALGNPYNGPRVPGCVGQPFDQVQVKMELDNGTVLYDNRACNADAMVQLVAPDGSTTTTDEGLHEGALLIKGPNVFKEYINKPEATVAEFDDEGYFKTGDVARYDGELDTYAILGRASADIIKSGGYKLSALEIERYILEHPNVGEVAVVGVDDDEWGQRVAAVVVRKSQDTLELDALRAFLKEKMSGYKLPTILKVLDEIPKNAMGKVNKKSLVKELF
eukprot:TRINITY_DN6579_c0_g1_i1.p1 TRINITY_DN6579_c0_g1~~TRINITY_DN6579_c0_g1_i1.p1  ORF type:complete len:581 (+),score=138.88 TRINITY_DN6579_c0_g1_i1:24-1745(+)